MKAAKLAHGVAIVAQKNTSDDARQMIEDNWTD
jgi:hypothetical protein